MSDYVRDLLERAAWTAIQGALAAGGIEQLAAGNVDAMHAAVVGAIAAVLSMIKSIAARRVGDSDSAATLR